MQVKEMSKKPPDFNFYSKQIKPEMKEMSPKLYDQYINKTSLSQRCFGIAERSNKSGQRETVREPDSDLSIFDD